MTTIPGNKRNFYFSRNLASSTLSRQMVAFCRLLREQGMNIGVADTIEALKALCCIDMTQKQQFRTILQLLLARNHREVQLFGRLFEQFWENAGVPAERELNEPGRPPSTPPPRQARRKQSWERRILNWADPEDGENEMQVPGYSPVRVLTYKDFSDFTAEEMQEMVHLIHWISRNLAVQFGRRMRQTHRLDRFDFRKTLRKNLRRGGEIVDLSYRTRKQQKFRLLILCDVSRSMDLYSRFLIQFIYAFQNGYRSIETFVFSTSLFRITDILRQGDIPGVLSRLAVTVPEWSGGTRIGESLERFLHQYGKFYLDRRTVVMILSDGWDTGDTKILSQTMAEIHRCSAFVIWLNPLMGYRAYEPSCRGMQAALPYIDVLAPVHNVDSLKSLIRLLIQLRCKAGLRKRARGPDTPTTSINNQGK